MAVKIVTQQLNACAAAAKMLFQTGIYGPKVEEIAKAAHGQLWPVGPEDFDWVKKHIVQVKNILEAEDFTVTLVNKVYYGHYRRRIPSTIEEALSVLPMRGSFSAAGIHFSSTEDDTIWLASQRRAEDGSIGGVKKVAGKYDKAVKKKLISLKDGKALIQRLKDKVSQDDAA